MAHTILSVTPEHVGALSAKGAVELIAELLRAEARRIGVPTTKVRVSIARINVADGGVDASVNSDDVDDPRWDHSFIPDERTSLQIKTGDSFKPWQESEIRKELFGDKEPSKDNLAQSVRNCLDDEGVYVLVCTGTDPNEKELIAAEANLKKSFEQCGYVDAEFEVWGQSTIVGLLETFPALALGVNGNAGVRFQTHKVWSSQDQMRHELQITEKHTTFIEGARTELRREDRPVHIRIRGEAGIGKTRLVLETTADDDLRPLVLYFDGPAQLLNGELMTTLLREGSDVSAILVVDECDADNRARLWNHLKSQSPRLKLVTISNEFDDAAGNTAVFDAPPLNENELRAIIESYGVPNNESGRWAALCDGSPRVAHVVGESLRAHPDEFRLSQPDTAIIWDRFVAGSDDPKGIDVSQRRTVLQHIALFRRFGFQASVAKEATAVAALVESADKQITAHRFREIVQLLRSRKVLQGESTLYITPRLLHIKLWADWWEVHGDHIDLNTFLQPLPEQLVDWFHEMFRYARESGAAMRLTERLLNENDAFGDTSFFANGRAVTFFRALTDAAPKAALRYLQRSIGQMSLEQLVAFGGDQRRQVVWSLEAIAVWRELFPDAARLLLKLAEAENESIGNNASGVFAELFSLGHGNVAPTEAPPGERFPVLKEALESTSKAQRLLGIDAADQGLKTGFFSRLVGAEHQGLRNPPKLWIPATWGELFDGYRRVWRLLLDRLRVMEPDERVKAIGVMTRHTRGLFQMSNIFETVSSGLSQISDQFPDSRPEIVEAIETAIHYDGKSFRPEQLANLYGLREQLVEKDFHSRLKRHVAMDLILDHFDQDGQMLSAPSEHLKALAEQAIAEKDLLTPELSWLVQDDVKNGFEFGVALATVDPELTLLPKIVVALLEARENGNAFFASGYFRVIFERDPNRWETLLDELTSSRELRRLVPELTWRSGMTDRAALRVLSLAKDGVIRLETLRMFTYGGVIKNIPAETFEKWLELLLDADTEDTVTIALNLFLFYYVFGDALKPLPRELGLKVLTAAPFFRGSESRRLEREDYHWTQVTHEFLKQYPDDSLPIAHALLSSFGQEGTVSGSYNTRTEEILDSVARRHPAELWTQIAEFLGPPIDERAFHIRQWLRKGGLIHFSQESLWQWIDANVEKRAWYAATFVPAVFVGSTEKPSWARELLVRHGDRKDVRSNLHANFGTEFWSGPVSVHYQNKKERLEEFRSHEDNANVRLWLDEAIESLESRIAAAKIDEERGF